MKQDVRVTMASLAGQLAIGSIVTPLLTDWTGATKGCALALAACLFAASRVPLTATLAGGGVLALWLSAVERRAWIPGDCEPEYTAGAVEAMWTAGALLFALALLAAVLAQRVDPYEREG